MGLNHPTAMYQMNYGLGSLNQDLPGLTYHEETNNSVQLHEALAWSSDHRPVLTANNAPEHIGLHAAMIGNLPDQTQDWLKCIVSPYVSKAACDKAPC